VPVLTRAQVVARYGHLRPDTWGFGGPGVVRDLRTSRRVIALTFDACGGPGGSGYDQALIGFLRRREVPATLFLNSRWIDANPVGFGQLAGEPLFEIANHGTRHLPLSVTGRPAYGIGGTRNAGEVYDEVATNQAKLGRGHLRSVIHQVSFREPPFLRFIVRPRHLHSR
jgi:peptidoglycan/xylan/chitin deacetylase (PgdA/CDA1 family)